MRKGGEASRSVHCKKREKKTRGGKEREAVRSATDKSKRKGELESSDSGGDRGKWRGSGKECSRPLVRVCVRPDDFAKTFRFLRTYKKKHQWRGGKEKSRKKEG